MSATILSWSLLAALVLLALAIFLVKAAALYFLAAILENAMARTRFIILAGVQDARFKAPALPGDRLRLEVRADGAFAGMMKLRGTVSCEGRDLCTAALLVKRL